jgi:hypothetical protein
MSTAWPWRARNMHGYMGAWMNFEEAKAAIDIAHRFGFVSLWNANTGERWRRDPLRVWTQTAAMPAVARAAGLLPVPRERER